MKDEYDLFLLSLGKRIRDLRQDANLSQAELSVKTEIEQSIISRIEQGQNNTSVITLAKLAKAFNLTPSELLDFPADQ